MLVLDRKKGQTIFMKNKATGEIIAVKVLECDGNRAKLGFLDDSGRYDIWREEIRPRTDGKPNGD